VVAQKIVYPPSPNRQYSRETVKDLEIEGKTKIKYRLKTGDVLGIIAENYEVRVADLKYWNNIYNERKIQAGKNLDIFVDDNKAEYYQNLAGIQKTSKKTVSESSRTKSTTTLKVEEDLSSAKKIKHTVKNGESPYVIAKKYKGVSPDQILKWNNIDDARKIQIGQILIVYLIK
jgi:membrane-bound lytic murein transglycosylase D